MQRSENLDVVRALEEEVAHGQASPTLKYRQPKKYPFTTVGLSIFKRLAV
jgi:hypothetical protein